MGSRMRICSGAVAALLVVISFGAFVHGQQTNIDLDDKWAWGTNIGWINFAPEHGGVSVFSDHLEGYAWGENIGWIRMGTYEGGDAHTYENTAADNYGVNRDVGGNLSGYAWGTNVGWINFAPAHGGVRINRLTNEFEGDAWGENVGWIRFNGDGYLVKFTGFPPAPLPSSGAGSNLAPVPDAGKDQVVRVGETATLDGSRSHDGESAAPASVTPQGSSDADGTLEFRWAFAIRYMSGGVPVYMIPEGSDCFASCRNFDSPTASFIPDVEGEYTLSLYVTDEDGECMFDQVVVTAIYDPDFVPEEPDDAGFALERIVCFPNPFSGEISFGYIGEGTPDSINVSVFDLAGHLVWQGNIDAQAHLTWDGYSAAGERLPDGGYVCVVAVVGNGEIHTEKTIVFIRR